MSDFLIMLAVESSGAQDISALDVYIRPIVNAAVSISHALALFVIGVGVIKAMVIFVRDALFGHTSADAIVESRLELGHSFSLGLGILIGGSILRTTVAPNWEEIGMLASIIAIRTVLTYFLIRDIARDLERRRLRKRMNRPHDHPDEDRDLDTLQEAEDLIARRAHADELKQDDKT